MEDIVERLRTITGQAGDHGDVQLCMAAAAEIERLRAEIDRLRSQPCPYVTGTVTRSCTLTPLTLTDAEREAVKEGIYLCEGAAGEANENINSDAWAKTAGVLRGLLERLGGSQCVTK